MQRPLTQSRLHPQTGRSVRLEVLVPPFVVGWALRLLGGCEPRWEQLVQGWKEVVGSRHLETVQHWGQPAKVQRWQLQVQDWGQLEAQVLDWGELEVQVRGQLEVRVELGKVKSQLEVKSWVVGQGLA